MGECSPCVGRGTTARRRWHGGDAPRVTQEDARSRSADTHVECATALAFFFFFFLPLRAARLLLASTIALSTHSSVSSAPAADVTSPSRCADGPVRLASVNSLAAVVAARRSHDSTRQCPAQATSASRSLFSADRCSSAWRMKHRGSADGSDAPPCCVGSGDRYSMVGSAAQNCRQAQA